MSAPSPRRYLVVWLRRLATDRVARRSSAPPDAPLVTVAPIKGALRLQEEPGIDPSRVIVGEEVECAFPETGQWVHVNVLGLSGAICRMQCP